MLMGEGDLEQEPLLQPSQPTGLHAYPDSAQQGQTPTHTGFVAQQQQEVLPRQPVLAHAASPDSSWSLKASLTNPGLPALCGDGGHVRDLSQCAE
jgi:hypothetical protein